MIGRKRPAATGAHKKLSDGHVNLRDLSSAGLVFLIGGLTLFEANRYPFGTVRNMGPGFFPTIVGLALLVLGAAILAGGRLHGPAVVGEVDEDDGEVRRRSIRSLIVLPAAILVFAALVRGYGLAPATFLSVLVSAFADTRVRFIRALAIAAAVTLLCLAIFSLGLGIQVKVFAW